MAFARCYVDNVADEVKVMVRPISYRGTRLPSEQVEQLGNNFAYAMSTRTPEPRSAAASATPQPVTKSPSQSAQPKQKRTRNMGMLRELEPHKKSPEPRSGIVLEHVPGDSAKTTQPKRKQTRNTTMLRELEPCNKSPEPESEVASEVPQPRTRAFPQPASRKRKRPMNLLRELESHNKSPEPESDAASEAPQSVSRVSLKPASRKRKRNTSILSEVRGFTRSLSPDSDSEQEASRPVNTRLSQPPARQQRKSRLLREIEAHNESPERDSDPDVEMLQDNSNFSRHVRQQIVNVCKNNPEIPRENLNVDRLMLNQLRGVTKKTKTFYPEGSGNLGPSSDHGELESMEEPMIKIEEIDENEYLPKHAKTNARTHSQAKSTHQTVPEQLGSVAGTGRRDRLVSADSPWFMWDNDKGRIEQLLKTPGYHPRPSLEETGVEGRFQGAFRVEQGLHIFTPTATEFIEFKSFLAGVEEIAGRKDGVVKVIVPSERLSGIPTPVMRSIPKLPVIETLNVKMSLKKGAVEAPYKIYDLLMTNDSPPLEPADLLRVIELKTDTIIQKRTMVPENIDRDDVWRESHARVPYTEERMIQRSEKYDRSVLCSLSELANHDMRTALRCKHPSIEFFSDNRFQSSRSTEPGLNEPVFHVATGAGPLSPLQMNKFAAYSINYHHSGAPRVWTVTRPEDHAELEDAVYMAQDSGNLFINRPPKPPTCSRFVAHQPMYVPQRTLSSYNVAYTEVVQNQGELVITFPYSYHQSYTSGPNITEEMLYASERSGVFHRENLFHYCGPTCAAREDDEFDIGLVFFKTLSGARSDGRYCSSLERSQEAERAKHGRQSGEGDGDESDEPLRRRRRRHN